MGVQIANLISVFKSCLHASRRASNMLNILLIYAVISLRDNRILILENNGRFLLRQPQEFPGGKRRC